MFQITKALVTGASSGIGKAIADQLLGEGCEVFALSRRMLDENQFQKGGTLHQIACDIADEQSLIEAFDQIKEKTDRLDVLFSNAGFGIAGAIADTPKTQVIRQFDLNVFSAVEVIRKAIPLLETAGGRILLTSSVAAVVPLPFQSFYSATKASLNILAQTLDTELKPFGIRAIAVMPGDVSTNFTDHRDKKVCPVTHYGERCESSIARMEKDEREGTAPRVIAGKFIRIAKKNHPKPLYGLGFFYKCVLLLYKLLPVRLMNKLIALLYG